MGNRVDAPAMGQMPDSDLDYILDMAEADFLSQNPAPVGVDVDDPGQQKLQEYVDEYNRQNPDSPITVDDLPDRSGIMGGASELAHGTLNAARDQFPEDMARIWQGDDVKVDDDSYAQEVIDEQAKDRASRVMSKQYIMGDKVNRSLYEGPASVATSAAVGTSGAVAGGAAGSAVPVVGTTVGAMVGAGAATGPAFYRMAKNQFLHEMLDVAKQNNINLTEPEWEQIKQDIDAEATAFGAWEAGPEAVSQAVTAGLLKGVGGKVFGKIPGLDKITKAISERALARVGAKLGAEVAEEEITEYTTYQGQEGIRQDMGLRQDAPSLGEFIDTQAGPVAVGSLLQMGVHKAGSMALGQRPQEQPVAESPQAMGSPVSVEQAYQGKGGMLAPEGVKMTGAEVSEHFAQGLHEALNNVPDAGYTVEDVNRRYEEAHAPTPAPFQEPAQEFDMGTPTVTPGQVVEPGTSGEQHYQDVPGYSAQEVNDYYDQGMRQAVEEGSPFPQAGDVFAMEQPEAPIAEKANEAATSPANGIPQPSQAEKEAGNYKKGHVRVMGMDMAIENPAGSERTGVDRDGKPWAVKMHHHYGYIKGTVGKDKDHLDIFLKEGAEAEDIETSPVYVVDQVNEDGSFDEHKVLAGFESEQEAREGYLANYEEGWQGLGAITAMSPDQFKEWTQSGKTKNPLALKEAAPVETTSEPDYKDGVTANRLKDAVAEKNAKAIWDLVWLKDNKKTRAYLEELTGIKAGRLQGEYKRQIEEWAKPNEAHQETPKAPETGDVNVKSDGTPYTEKAIRLVVNRKIKMGTNVEAVQLDQEGKQWGWREVKDEGPAMDQDAQTTIRGKILEAVPDRDYDTMMEKADSLIDDEGYSVDDVYEVVNQIEEEGAPQEEGKVIPLEQPEQEEPAPQPTVKEEIDEFVEKAKAETESEAVGKETEKGIMLFARSKGPAKGMGKKMVESAIRKLQREARNALPLKVVNSVDELPGHIQREIKKKGSGVIKGVNDNGRKAYMIAGNLDSAEEVVSYWMHEQGLHRGLRGIFGPRAYVQTMNKVFMSAGGKKAFRDTAELYGLDLNNRQDRLLAAEEYLAHIAEDVRLDKPLSNRAKRVWQSFVKAVAEWLRDMGVHVRLTDAEIAQIVDDAVQWTMNGPDGPGGGVRFGKEEPAVAFAKTEGQEGKSPEQAAMDYGQRVIEASEAWGQEVDNALAPGANRRAVLKMGQTPSLLVELGAPDLPMTMRHTTLEKVLGIKPDKYSHHTHELTVGQLKGLYKELADPVAVISQRGDKFKVVVDMLEDGKPIAAFLDLAAKDGRIEVNSVATAFGDERNFRSIVGAAANGGLEYMDPKKIDALEDKAGNRQPDKPVGARVLRARRGKKIKFPTDVVKPSYPEDAQGGVKFAQDKSTNSLAFKEWFGDSVVVDEDGNPMIVKHATNADFESFSKKFLGSNTEGNASDEWMAETAKMGFWFHKEGIANRIAADREIPVYLSLQNPFETSLDDLAESIEDAGSANGYRNFLMDEGHDGIILEDGEFGGQSYIAFESSQVKSIFNKGTFDPRDNRIMFSRAKPSPVFLQDVLAQMQATQGEGPLPKEAADVARILTGKPSEIAEAAAGGESEISNRINKKDLSFLQEVASLPHWIAKRFPQFDDIYRRQLSRMDERAAALKESLEEVEDFFTDMSKEEHKELRDIIWKIDGKKLDDMGDKFVRVQDDEGRDVMENGRPVLEMNEEYYQAFESWADRQGLTPKVKTALVALRKSLDKDFLRAYDAMRKMAEIDDDTIKEFRSNINHTHNYFPHKRYGAYYVQAVGDNHVGQTEDGKWAVFNAAGKIISDEFTQEKTARRHLSENKRSAVYREHYDANTKWLAERSGKKKIAALKEEYTGDLKWSMGTNERLPDEVYEFGIDTNAMEQIILAAADNLEDKDQAKEIKANLASAAADVMKSRGWSGASIKRKGIPGHELDDIQGVVYDYKAGLSGWLTKMDASRDFTGMLGKINAKNHPREYNYATKYVQNMLRNADRIDRAVGNIKALAFLWYLGFNLKTAALNLTQNIIAGVPRLSMDVQGGGKKYARAAMAKLVDGATGRKTLAEDEARLMDELYREDVITEGFLNEIRGKVQGVSFAGISNKILKAAGWPMAMAERFNRGSLALAAYRAARDGKITNQEVLDKFSMKSGQGFSFDDAKAYAEDIVRDAHFVYGKTNLPQPLRNSTLGRGMNPAYTFRTFSHNILSLWNWMLNGQGIEGKKAFAKSMVGTMAIGGFTALPFYSTLMHLFQWATDDDDDWTEEIRKQLPEGDMLRDMVSYGLPAGAGFSLGGSVGLETPILGRIEPGATPEESIADNLGDIFGIPYDMFIRKPSRVMKALKAGDEYRAIEEAAPTIVKNGMAGFRMWKDGQYSMSGKPINEPGQPGARKLQGAEAMGKIAGFQPISSRKSFDKYRAREVSKKVRSDKAGELANLLVRAYRENDKAQIKAVLKEVRSWNEQAKADKKLWMVITRKDLVARIKSKMKNKGVSPREALRIQAQMQAY